jgi:hypothetical protein
MNIPENNNDEGNLANQILVSLLLSLEFIYLNRKK